MLALPGADTVAVELPRGGLPSMSQLLTGGAPPWAFGLALAGDLIWAGVYVLAIVIGFRQKTYAIPMTAIGLNFTWEVVHTAVYPPPVAANLAANLLWLAFDLIIVLQLIRYGRAQQRLPWLRQRFTALVATLIGLALVGHLTFYTHVTSNAIFPDRDGVVSAFLINLVMSVLFIGMYFSRPAGEGLSLGIAWGKLLGTGLISLANVVALRTIAPVAYDVQVRRVETSTWVDAGRISGHTVHPGFLYFLFAAILLFDAVYLALLYRRPSRLAAPATA